MYGLVNPQTALKDAALTSNVACCVTTVTVGAVMPTSALTNVALASTDHVPSAVGNKGLLYVLPLSVGVKV